MAHFYRELRIAAGSAAPPGRRVAPASWSPPATADWKPFDPFESLSKQEEEREEEREEEQEGAAAAPPPPTVSDCRRAAAPSRSQDADARRSSLHPRRGGESTPARMRRTVRDPHAAIEPASASSMRSLPPLHLRSPQPEERRH